MKTTWSSRIVKLSSSARLLSASVTTSQLAVSARAGVIALKAIVGRFVTFLDFADEFSAQDDKAFTLVKGLRDSIAALEALNREFRKAKQDETQVSDSAFRSAIKSLTDASGVADDEYRAFGKVLRDGASFLDAYRIAYGKGLSDTARFSDTHRRDVTKDVADSFAAADKAAFSLSRSLADSFAALDIASRLVEKVLFDAAQITDDVDGQASIDDDQEVNFVKVISQQALASEEFSRIVAFTRAYQEIATATDLASVGAEKPRFDLASIADAYVHVFSKNAIDGAELSDLTIRASGKAIVEPALAADLFSFLFETARFDGATVTDAAQVEAGKVFQDASQVSDSFDRTVAFVRPFEDIPVFSSHHFMDFFMVQDDVYMQGFDYFAQDYVEDGDRFFIRDACSPALTKRPSDNAQFSDLISSRQVGKGILDTAWFDESQARFITKTLIEGFTATDDFDGNASALDDETMSFTKTRTDNAGASDALTYVAQFFRTPSETAQFQDAINRQCGKPLADAMRALDAPALTFSRPASDAFTATDLFARVPGKGLNDQATFTDTGSLRSQGYCDFSYFAEDFVGASRTF